MPQAKQARWRAQWVRLRELVLDLPSEAFGARPVVRRLRTLAQFAYLVVRGFADNRCPMQAAALAYTTLLALVPVLAVALGVSKNFLKDASANVVPVLLDKAVAWLAPQLEYMPLQPGMAGPPAPGQPVISSAARQRVVEQIQNAIGNIEAGTLTTVGMIFLIVVAIRLLMTIEASFNNIWGVTRGRSLWRKVVYYWTSLTLGPLVLIAAVAITGRAEFAHAMRQLATLPWAERLLFYLGPFVVLWIGFAAMYALVPNTQVRFAAALAGGVVGGTLWQLNNLLSTLYVSRVLTYSKIYGALGIVPVLLIAIYFAWLIVLFGAQVSFAAQHLRTFMQQRASERADEAARELLACRLVLAACRSFLQGQPPPTAAALAEQLGAPLQLVNRLVRRLSDGGVLVELAGEAGGLQPARPPESLTLADVLHVVRTQNGRCGEAPPTPPPTDRVAVLLHELHVAERRAAANLTFRELAAA